MATAQATYGVSGMSGRMSKLKKVQVEMLDAYYVLQAIIYNLSTVKAGKVIILPTERSEVGRGR